MKNLYIKISLLFLATIHFFSCGEVAVDLGLNTYAPKIVIEGYLTPNKKIDGIKITRNIPLNTQVNPALLILSNADVRITDLQSNKEYKLTFVPAKLSYEYNGTDLKIGFDKSYKLNVTATIDGKVLSTSSITKTPKEGFRIIHSLSDLNPMFYREKDDLGNVKNFSIKFFPSAETDFYLISIVALEASEATFVYDNPFITMKREDLLKRLDQFKYQLKWLQNINSFAGSIHYDLDWLDLWFYGKYRTIVYAGDQNFKLFMLTHKNVQEFDGNFHEPRLNLQGDGIGVFGSLIADTVYFQVKK